MIKLKISVTKEILAQSMYCSKSASIATSSCAISLAIRDIFPKASVWCSHINPKINPARYDTIPLPKEAGEFIKEFDELHPDSRLLMEPISFEIEIPDAVLDQINIDELKPLLVNHPTLALV